MIYGLYLSATGVLANSHRQDVIANNLANAETAGFKRDLALFQERRTAAQELGLNPRRHSNVMLEGLGGGLGSWPTWTDQSAGDLESTGNPLDVAIRGRGYLAVRRDGQVMLTRDGRMMVDSEGRLTLASGAGEVLDVNRQPIVLGKGQASVGEDGTITQDGKAVAKLGLFDVADPGRLRKRGEGLMSDPQGERGLRESSAMVAGGHVERSNADPATELVAMMDAQRQLEANANMLRYQDQTLARLVNDVGKIG